jgi:putative transposase
MLEGYAYHLTHRCHNRAFLLRFVKDRDAYREWLRVGVNRYKVPVFAYAITNNHVHLVVHVRDRDAVGRLKERPNGLLTRCHTHIRAA